jgi:uncharacterized protein YecE (DUF72 family)
LKSGKPRLQESFWAEDAAEPVTEPVEGSVQKLASVPGVRMGTSAFTAAGWPGTFYPAGLPPRDYLSYYSRRFDTVEVDSTFYKCPATNTVRGWYEKTPDGFLFSAKVPRSITHEKYLVDCDTEMTEFLSTMALLKEKLGPLLLQFGYFSDKVFRGVDEFLPRLAAFLDKLPSGPRYAVEIRNKQWLVPEFIEALRERGVALALIDQSWMPTWMSDPKEWERRGVDLLTADFTYIRWLGDRKGIEAITKSWDRTVVDRKSDLQKWVETCVKIRRRGAEIYAYANNHYAGHGPATLALFAKLLEEHLGSENGG